MMLKRMRKITALADGALRERLLMRLTELGVSHFHLQECFKVMSSHNPQCDGEVNQVQLDVLVDHRKSEEIIKGLSSEIENHGTTRITVSEVLAGPVYEDVEGRKRGEGREVRWGDYLITV